MKKNSFYVSFLAVAVLFSPAAYSQPPSADDFLAPSKGGASDIQDASKVKIDVQNNVVVAATIQDAILAGQEHKVQSEMEKGVSNAEQKETLIRKRDFSSSLANRGAWTAATESGLAFFATGCAVYGQFPDDTATLVAQRRAYVVASMEAKGLLTELQNKIETEGATFLGNAMDQALRATGSASNTLQVLNERIGQASDGILRGAVVFEVKDEISKDKRTGTVFVTLVSSPKTQGKLSRLSSNTIEAKQKLSDGIAEVLDDIKSGVVPPIGGLTIGIPQTQEFAFIGFGSHVIAFDDDPVAQSRIVLNSQRIAELRARDALFAVIGDEEVVTDAVTGTQGIDETVRFAREADPLNQNNADQIKVFGETKRKFAGDTGVSSYISTRRKGQLPPNVVVKNWFNEDKTWAISMAVYNPTLSDVARQAVPTTSVLEDDARRRGERDNASRTAIPSAQGSPISGSKPQEGTELRQGPTGQFYDPSKL